MKEQATTREGAQAGEKRSVPLIPAPAPLRVLTAPLWRSPAERPQALGLIAGAALCLISLLSFWGLLGFWGLSLIAAALLPFTHRAELAVNPSGELFLTRSLLSLPYHREKLPHAVRVEEESAVQSLLLEGPIARVRLCSLPLS